MHPDERNAVKKVSEALGGMSRGTAGEPGIPSNWVTDTALGSLRNAQPPTLMRPDQHFLCGAAGNRTRRSTWAFAV
jgi:hypothetical protein